MSWLDGFRHKVRTAFRRRAYEREVEAELRFHLTLDAMQRAHGGAAPDDAAYASRRDFGNVTSHREAVWFMSGLGSFDALRRELRYAVRGLLRAKSFTFAATVTLGLGIGGIAAVMAVLDAVVLAPLPYAAPQELAAVSLDFPRIGLTNVGQSDASYFALRRLSGVIQDIGAYTTTEVNVTGTAGPERVAAARITAPVFTVLRAAPLRGRLMRESDDGPGRPPVVVISEGLWRRRFGGEPNVVGQSLVVDGISREVIGVVPSRVAFPDGGVRLWLPLGLDPDSVMPGAANYKTVARLRAGVSMEAAQRDLDRTLQRLPELYPSTGFGITTRQLLEQTGARVSVRPLRDEILGDIAPMLWVIFGTGGFVLLVACANVAGLVLVRAEGHRRETAVRAALGARRGEVAARFLVEGAVLAIAGAAFGLGLAAGAVALLVRHDAFAIPRVNEVTVDGTTIALVVAITAAIALVCSLLPATRVRVGDIPSLLRSGGRGATASRDRQRARHALVVAQVALAFCLLSGSALLLRSFRELRNVHAGFDASNVQTMRVALPLGSYPRVTDVIRFHLRLQERLAAIPGVRAAGGISTLPLSGDNESRSAFWVEGSEQTPNALPRTSLMGLVIGDYFGAMRIPIIAGRTFSPIDPDHSLAEAIVSVDFARRQWNDSTGRRALGQRIKPAPDSPWMTIVGVVGSVRVTSLAQPPDEMVYLPPTSPWVVDIAEVALRAQDDTPPRVITLTIGAAGALESVEAAARREIATLDPGLPVFGVRPMHAVIGASMARTTFAATLLGTAALIALVLGIVGVYGVVAYTVSLRTREIGLRLALGARPEEVSFLMVRHGAVLTALGLGLGVGVTLALARFVRALLFGVTASDPATLIGVAAVLIAATFVATWVPARRAARIDPALVLAGE
jgi:putative ABC transport system permease protein